MRGNPKDDLHRARCILGGRLQRPTTDWMVSLERDDARWLLELVEELLSA